MNALLQDDSSHKSKVKQIKQPECNHGCSSEEVDKFTTVKE